MSLITRPSSLPDPRSSLKPMVVSGEVLELLIKVTEDKSFTSFTAESVHKIAVDLINVRGKRLQEGIQTIKQILEHPKSQNAKQESDLPPAVAPERVTNQEKKGPTRSLISYALSHKKCLPRDLSRKLVRKESIRANLSSVMLRDRI